MCQAPLTDDLLPPKYCETDTSETSETSGTLTDKNPILEPTKSLIPLVPAFRNLIADSIFTRDQALSRIHIVPLQVVSSAESIAQYLHSVPNYIQDGVECFRYSKVVAIRPTGTYLSWPGFDNSISLLLYTILNNSLFFFLLHELNLRNNSYPLTKYSTLFRLVWGRRKVCLEKNFSSFESTSSW